MTADISALLKQGKVLMAIHLNLDLQVQLIIEFSQVSSLETRVVLLPENSRQECQRLWADGM